MFPRILVSEDDLYAVLVRAFHAMKPLACDRCRMPRPQPVPRMRAEGANWALPTPPPCPHHCADFMGWIERQYGALYELEPREGDA